MSDRGASEAAFARARAGDVAGALACLRARVSEAPDDAAAWLTLGMLLGEAGDAAEAVVTLTRAVTLEGDVVLARVLLARALERVGRMDDAEAQLLVAASLSPSHAGIARELGAFLHARGRHDEALAQLARAASHALDGPEAARIALARGLVHEARRDLGAAIASYRDAVRLDPTLDTAWRTLADALAQVGEHAGAVTALDALLALRPRDESAAHNRAVLQAALAAMRARRLLGARPAALDGSAVVEGGEMQRAASPPGEVRFEGAFAWLSATLRADGCVASLFFAVTDAPDADAARFGVTVVRAAGPSGLTAYAAAATLTFLREALGVSMTDAARVLTAALDSAAPLHTDDAQVSFTSVADRHGILVRLPP